MIRAVIKVCICVRVCGEGWFPTSFGYLALQCDCKYVCSAWVKAVSDEFWVSIAGMVWIYFCVEGRNGKGNFNKIGAVRATIECLVCVYQGGAG